MEITVSNTEPCSPSPSASPSAFLPLASSAHSIAQMDYLSKLDDFLSALPHRNVLRDHVLPCDSTWNS